MVSKSNDFLRKTLFLSTLFFFCATQSLLAAGSGTMKGRVFDKDTKDALPGATVLVKGTSIGASTDLNGDYLIHNVPSGEQSVVVSYIGYSSLTVTVNVPDGQTITRDFFLAATAVQGKVVVVTAQAQGQIQAINQQLASNKIVNVVSDAKIQELPDFNAAQAISRLPGISVTQSSGEANKVVIRGLAPQYNEVAVGGITLASTGSAQIGATSLGLTSGNISNDRSVDLTMVTPYMIKSIAVYKSLTPDMEANAIGGYVDMELREAPSGIHGDALWQSGYTQKSNTYGNYRAVASVSDRFFNDLLGVYVLGNAEQYDRSADNMNASYAIASAQYLDPSGYHPVIVTGVTLSRHVETRKRYGGNVILDYKLPAGSIKSVNLFSRLNSNYQDYNNTLNYASTNYAMNFSYRAGDANTDVAVNSLELTNDFGFMSIDIKAANSYSRNYSPLSPYYTFFQNNAISHTHSVTGDTNIVPENLTRFVNYGPDSTTVLDQMSMFSSDYHENDQVYKGDFKIPLNFGSSVSGFFKFGGEYRYNYHTNNQSTPYIQLRGTSNINNAIRDSLMAHYNLTFNGTTRQAEGSNFTSTNAKLYDTFLGNKFGQVYWAADPTILNSMVNYFRANSSAFIDPNDPTGGGWYDGPYQELPNDYKYVERYYAAYLMSELDLGTDLMVVGGARYEADKGLYFVHNMQDERNPISQPDYPRTIYPQNHYWLPMVQAKYDLADWADLRYSYTQTLARPDYTQLSPHFYVVSGGGTVFAGNPNLKPAQAYNHDVLLTLHSNDIGLLSVGGFYKEINHFTFYTSYHLHSKAFYDAHGITGLDSINSFVPIQPNDDATLNTYINSPYKAYVRGIETDFETRFWYLPGFLNGIVFGINYTHIWSKATYPYFNEVPSGRTTVFVDSTRVGRLIYQPDDILNTYIGYDYRGFSARLSFVFQGNSVTNVGAFPEQDGFSKDYFRVDASARQQLPWKGLELYLDANNLNSETNVSIENAIGGFTSQQYYGLTADLGIRFTL